MFAFAFENISILLPLNICSRIQRREEECHVSRDVCHACPACEAGQGGDIMKTISKCDTTWELLATAHWMKVESSTAMAAVVRMAETE